MIDYTKQAKSLRGLAHMIIWKMLPRALASLRSHGTKVTPTAAIAYMLLLPLLLFIALTLWLWVFELWDHSGEVPGLQACAYISSIAFPIVVMHIVGKRFRKAKAQKLQASSLTGE